MDKVSRVIRQQHHNQAVSSMPLSLSLPPLPPLSFFFFFFDKQRNRITIWTGPGAAGEPALPFSLILRSVKGAQGRKEEEEKRKKGTNLPDGTFWVVEGESSWKRREGLGAKEQGEEISS